MKTSHTGHAIPLALLCWTACMLLELGLAIGGARAAPLGAARAARLAVIPAPLPDAVPRLLAGWPDPLHLCVILLVLGLLSLVVGLRGLGGQGAARQ